MPHALPSAAEAGGHRSVVFGADLEECPRVGTHRTALGSFLAEVQMPAVGADPDHVAVARKDNSLIDIVDKLAIACLMGALDFADHLEEIGNVGEALFACHPLEFGIHVGPFIVLACGGVFQIVQSVWHAVVQERGPDFWVLAIILGRLRKNVGGMLI